MPSAKPTLKAEETGLKILHAALALFRESGFDSATMRDIAARAQVATGAAYYYYPSKDAIIIDFYRRSCEQMQPKITEALKRTRTFEQRLRALIGVKLEQFAENRLVLRALLRNGADPKYPLSPFSPETAGIREIDIAWFGRILVDCGLGIPSDLMPSLPSVLWFYQMGIMFFWVIDDSPNQTATAQLLELSAKCIVALIRLSNLPLMRPVRKRALQLIEIVQGAKTWSNSSK